MRSKRKKLFEAASQEVIQGLGSKYPSDPVRFLVAIQRLQAILSASATCFLNRLRLNVDFTDEAVQQWYLAMLAGGFNRYVRNGQGRPFYPYGMRTLWTVCCSLRRSAFKFQQPSADAEADLAGSRFDPVDQALTNEVRQRILTALAKLPLSNVRLWNFGISCVCDAVKLLNCSTSTA